MAGSCRAELWARGHDTTERSHFVQRAREKQFCPACGLPADCLAQRANLLTFAWFQLVARSRRRRPTRRTAIKFEWQANRGQEHLFLSGQWSGATPTPTATATATLTAPTRATRHTRTARKINMELVSGKKLSSSSQPSGRRPPTTWDPARGAGSRATGLN